MPKLTTTSTGPKTRRAPAGRRRVVFAELRRRTLWFIRLRWMVPPILIVGLLPGQWLELEVPDGSILLVALFIALYNLVFLNLARRIIHGGQEDEDTILEFTTAQVVLDYVAIFLLIHLTGWTASPLIPFFIFHVIFASILLPARAAYGFAGIAVLGMIGFSCLHLAGWISDHAIRFSGERIFGTGSGLAASVTLTFFTASVLIVALTTTAIMRELRRRVVALSESELEIRKLNQRLSSLYILVQAVLTSREPKHVLDTAASEMCRVMEVTGIGIKLLSDDGRELRYAASEGLPREMTSGRAIQLEHSRINRRILEGEPFVTGEVTQKEMFQFGEDLEATGFRSVLFVPMKVDSTVMGILGAYCTHADRFDDREVSFFQLSAGLLAIAIENARSYQTIRELGQKRGQLMRRVAHNLRAPLAAMITMLDVIRMGSLGRLSSDQEEHLRRIDRRSRTMLGMVDKLMVLARSSESRIWMKHGEVNLECLAGRVRRTFADQVSKKGLRFSVSVETERIRARGDTEMLELALENTISNAVKYTQEGNVTIRIVTAGEDRVAIRIEDTGIGIHKEHIEHVFEEFYRAPNAVELLETGTGLGMAIVRDIVEAHGGKVRLESVPGEGTAVTLELPAGEDEPAT